MGFNTYHVILRCQIPVGPGKSNLSTLLQYFKDNIKALSTRVGPKPDTSKILQDLHYWKNHVQSLPPITGRTMYGAYLPILEEPCTQSASHYLNNHEHNLPPITGRPMYGGYLPLLEEPCTETTSLIHLNNDIMFTGAL